MVVSRERVLSLPRAGRTPARKSSPEALWCLPFLICTRMAGAEPQFCDQMGKGLRKPSFDGVERMREKRGWTHT